MCPSRVSSFCDLGTFVSRPRQMTTRLAATTTTSWQCLLCGLANGPTRCVPICCATHQCVHSSVLDALQLSAHRCWLKPSLKLHTWWSVCTEQHTFPCTIQHLHARNQCMRFWHLPLMWVLMFCGHHQLMGSGASLQLTNHCFNWWVEIEFWIEVHLNHINWCYTVSRTPFTLQHPDPAR